MIGNTSESSNPPVPSGVPAPRRVLAIWLPGWPVQRLIAGNNALRRTPVILYRNHPQRGQLVTEVSPTARLDGVRRGMPLPEARALVRGTCRSGADGGEGHVFQHDPGADREALVRLAVDCQRFSPLVGLAGTGDEQADGLWLEAGSVLHLFGGPDGLQIAVARHFQSAGLTIRQALASTPARAWGLARFACPPAAPAGQPEGMESWHREQEAFDRLPVAALRLSPLIRDNLRQLGIERVGQVRQLPRAGLRSRFGDQLTRRLDEADGRLEEVITAIHPPADLQASRFLDVPVSDRESLVRIVEQLAGPLCGSLRSQGRGGLVWHCRLSPPEQRQAPLDLTVSLFQPTARLDQLMPLVRMQLDDRWSPVAGRHPVPADFVVQEVAVSVSRCVLLGERQRSLFDENPRLDRLALSRLINRLASRLGAAHVVRPRLGNGVRAEEAAWFEPLVGNGTARPPAGPGRPPCPVSPLQRPLLLWSRPRAIAVVSLDGGPETDINLPALLVADNRRWPVARRWGPERIETSWWRGGLVRRDYWRVETVEGRWWWVFRDLTSGDWFWHGAF